MTPDQTLDLIKNGGAIIGAIYLLIKIIDFLRFVLSGIKESIDKITQVVNQLQKNQVEHDKQLGAIMDTQLVVSDGIKVSNTLLTEQNLKFDSLQGAADTGNKYTKDLTETIINSTKDTSTAVQAYGTAIMENSNRIGTEVQARLDKLPADILKEFDPTLEQIRTDLSKIIDPNLATQIANALQPGLVALVERVLVDCLKQNAELAKELDKATSTIDDTATRQAMLSMKDGAVNRDIIDAASAVIDKPQEQPK